MEFKTFSKSNAAIKPYLTGKFSRDHIAIPVKPIQSEFMDLVTFKIIPIKSVQSPGTVKTFIMLGRFELLGLSLYPFLAAILYFQLNGGTAASSDLVLSLVAMVFVHLSVFLLNDYNTFYSSR